MMKAVREVEFEGHLIDSMIFPKVLDTILDQEGEFEILEFRVGKKKTDTSYAKLLVMGKDEQHLNEILTELHRFGGQIPDAEDVELEKAPMDKVVPRGFYSTTNFPTFIQYNGKWIPVENIGMDKIIVVENGKAICKFLGQIRKGDMVVVGEKGIKILPPERPREKTFFKFMGGKVSSERPSPYIISRIASEISMIKKNGGKIAVVAGPAVVHTGADEALASMVRDGFVDLLLAGNALAVHDIEYNLYGTSLGMDVKTGELVPGGHKHHIYAISEIMSHGSIARAVEKGVLKGGIMYECIKNDIPFILAGSIRDDGPLPEVITDVMRAKELMAEALRNIDMVLMLSTMLHSIAVGNLLPFNVKTVCVDINPSTVTKLMDRGTAQAIGVVTDIGVFLPMLVERLSGKRY
jgi:lysine-ketoglutarate reductase/saccharopine dehydrogenase-like protein (TIGR00300 family)